MTTLALVGLGGMLIGACLGLVGAALCFATADRPIRKSRKFS